MSDADTGNEFRPPPLGAHYARSVQAVEPRLLPIVESAWSEAWHLGATAGLSRNSQPIRLLAAEVFPHRSGNFTVLGPEIFASDDEQVICWKGRNYVPQPEPRVTPVDELPRGQCGSRDEHEPHVHDSPTLGTFRCGGLVETK